MVRFSKGRVVKMKKVTFTALCLSWVVLAFTQERLPRERHWDQQYHPYPHYRESESHPLRIAAYLLHPVGWALREVIFRPLSSFAASTEKTRSILGHRLDGDYRESQCFDVPESVNCFDYPPFKRR